mgnify:CR=1 FL=1
MNEAPLICIACGQDARHHLCPCEDPNPEMVFTPVPPPKTSAPQESASDDLADKPSGESAVEGKKAEDDSLEHLELLDLTRS